MGNHVAWRFHSHYLSPFPYQQIFNPELPYTTLDRYLIPMYSLTMKSFKKKPVIIQAIQLTALNIEEIEEFVGGDASVVDGELVIATLEGPLHASLNDWIIRGIKGEFYPCKPDIFKETYEEVK